MLLLALLAQIGPAPAGTLPLLPAELVQRADTGAAPVAEPDLVSCLGDAERDPLVAVENATAWRNRALGRQKVQAGHCLGVALSALGRWQPALIAFAEARDALPAADRDYRARLGAMAGNAALAGGNADAALPALDTASADAEGNADKALTGNIALDRARALVALDRETEAEAALATARTAMTGSAQAWLLSATLSRRLGKLAQAQAAIEKAGELLPTSPEIGLEAGVIAVLSGRDEAARKSWQSVVDAAPRSPSAETARGYIAQLGQPDGTGR